MHACDPNSTMRPRRLLPCLALALAVLLGQPDPAAAQAFPSKPVRIVVPFSAGGASDTMGRAIGQKLAETWGQPVVIENRPGAATSIAAQYVARSAPDGHTLLLAANETLTINQSLFRKLSYDPARDFAMVRGLFAARHILVVHDSVPARTLGDLVGFAKANPEKLAYGSSGNGATSHLNMELFKSLSGAPIAHVPYKGAAPAMTDLASGQVQMMLINISISLPHIKAGRLRALGIAGHVRSPVMPDLPTFAESGFAGFESLAWFGLVAPAGTPRPVIDRISADSAAAVNLPEIREQRLTNQGLEPFTLDPDQFARLVSSDTEKFARLIRQTGATAD